MSQFVSIEKSIKCPGATGPARQTKLPKTPFFVHFDAKFGASFGGIVPSKPTIRQQRRHWHWHKTPS